MKYGLIIVILSLLLLTACTDEESSLTVVNSTLTESEVRIDDFVYFIEAGESVTENWKISNSIFEDNQRKIYLRVKEKMFMFSEEGYYAISSGKNYRKVLVNNAAGLRIVNNAISGRIIAVYIAPSSDINWGTNKIDEDITNGNKMDWNLTSGLWDIKIIDDMNNEITSYDYNYEIGKLRTINYTGIGRTVTTDVKEKKAKIEIQNPRIEIVR